MSAPVDERRELARSTATQTVLTAVSRLTGFARIVVVAAVLGTTFLGNTYQSANTIPNIVFELFAAGALQAVLVPALVTRFRSDPTSAGRLAGSVLGHSLVLLGALVVVGVVTAPLLMELLVSGVADDAVRDRQVQLGTTFLWIFLPQIVVYDVGLVATAYLHARRKFALPAVAPAVNNVVVCAAYGTFWILRDGAAPSLDLTGLEIAVLAGGTSLAVVAFCALPVLGAWRAGFRFRPNLDRSDPELRALGRRAGWAVAYLAMTQVLLAAVLIVANRVEGGVVAYQVAFVFFLLPHSLFALPVMTTLFPEAAEHHQDGAHERLTATVERGVRAIAFFVLPVAACLTALADPVARVALFGEAAGSGLALVTAATVGFGPGLIGYSLFYFATRMFYAVDDTRTPATVHAAVVVAGVVAMFAAAGRLEGASLVGALGWTHSAVYLVGAAVLGVLLLRRVDGPVPAAAIGGTVRATLARGSATAVVAGGVAWLVAARLPAELLGSDRLAAVVVIVVAGACGLVVQVAGQQLIGGTRAVSVLRLLVPDRRG